MISEVSILSVPSQRSLPARWPWEESLADTASRLALDVVCAFEDGDSAVPEIQRFAAWLRGEALPYAATAMAPEEYENLRDLTDEMRGAAGEHAARLAAEARMSVIRLP